LIELDDASVRLVFVDERDASSWLLLDVRVESTVALLADDILIG
jgi:hypothetical protein